uniref:Uncharacterized protein MANES_02G173000 n=1 Tax=Rhizophora mucronata TaxID=61149 RepID=A0A2P2JPF6_RHIMU
MSVVPKVWKRLMITFLAMFLAFGAYNVVAFLVMIVCLFLFEVTNAPYLTLIILPVAYFLGLVYMSIVWHLATVVSVLEEACGFKAMTKTSALIKGKMWIAVIVFLKLILSFVVVLILFEKLVVSGNSFGALERVAFGVICLLLLLKLFLFQLVIQTVIYFVCKSYHHENIDKSALSDHLEVYLGDYVPLKSKDVQLEQYEV